MDFGVKEWYCVDKEKRCTEESIMDQIKIGNFITDMRKAKNITQKQLAEQLGISDRTVSKWECGD